MNWAIWRPVLSNLDTLTNVKKLWTIDDLADAHEALDERDELERRAIEEARNK